MLRGYIMAREISDRLTRDRQLEHARERLHDILEQYIQVESEVRALEEGQFRVVIFGSARIGPHDEVYQVVYRIAHVLAEHKIDIVTGGGPGLMEAANRAVQEVAQRESRSYGLPIDIPSLREPANRHLDIKSSHVRFTSRLDEFMRLSNTVIVAPGGIGTLLELVYVWQLLQVGMTNDRPVILFRHDVWSGLLRWMREALLPLGYISPSDFRWIRLVDSEEEVIRMVLQAQEHYVRALRDRRLPEAAMDRQVTESLLEEWPVPTELTEEATGAPPPPEALL